MTTLLRWRDGRLVDADPSHTAGLLVADSWLIRAGRARWAERHLARFLAASFDYTETEIVLSFLDIASHTLGAIEDAWPRLELQPGTATEPPSLALRIRPVPPIAAQPASVWLFPQADPRRAPRIKGPDLDLGRQLRAQAPAGCDEVIVRGGDGLLREGVWSSLVYWRGDQLVAPPPDAAVLPGITRDGLLELAQADGIGVQRRSETLDRLDGCEIWLLSAVQGIRPVARWIGADTTPAEPRHVALWQDRLQAAARPIRDLPRDWSDRYT
jgi:branched-subunit amino acid aminotransferase/4-amino-4-deoxychorismate lyase